jgi:hypothetical protein
MIHVGRRLYYTGRLLLEAAPINEPSAHIPSVMQWSFLCSYSPYAGESRKVSYTALDSAKQDSARTYAIGHFIGGPAKAV